MCSPLCFPDLKCWPVVSAQVGEAFWPPEPHSPWEPLLDLPSPHSSRLTAWQEGPRWVWLGSSRVVLLIALTVLPPPSDHVIPIRCDVMDVSLSINGPLRAALGEQGCFCHGSLLGWTLFPCLWGPTEDLVKIPYTHSLLSQSLVPQFSRHLWGKKRAGLQTSGPVAQKPPVPYGPVHWVQIFLPGKLYLLQKGGKKKTKQNRTLLAKQVQNPHKISSSWSCCTGHGKQALQ